MSQDKQKELKYNGPKDVFESLYDTKEFDMIRKRRQKPKQKMHYKETATAKQHNVVTVEITIHQGNAQHMGKYVQLLEEEPVQKYMQEWSESKLIQDVERQVILHEI